MKSIASALVIAGTLSLSVPAVHAAASDSSSLAVDPAQILVEQVSGVIEAKDTSDAEKSRQLRSVISTAVVAALGHAKNSSEGVTTLLQLAKSLAPVSGSFGSVIVDAMVDAAKSVPLFAKHEGLHDMLLAVLEASDAETAQAESDDRRRNNRRNEREFGGRTDDHIVSPSS